jgi:signal transduction histidine kinase/ligand-binding sensor domain-containing protein
MEQGLPHRVVTDMLETRAGEFWLATNGGLVRFNPQGVPANHIVEANAADAATAMFTVVWPADTDRVARAATSLLESRDGTLWCGTRKHLYRLERRDGRFDLALVDLGFDATPRQVYVLDLLEDRQGSLWIGTNYTGLYRRWPDGRTRHYTERDGLPDKSINDLFEDHQERLWAGTRLGGFFRFNTYNPDAPLVVQRYGRPDGYPTDWVFRFYETADRRFWIASNQGLVEFFPDGDGQDRRFRTYTHRNGLSFREITALNEDAGGNLWLGTISAGAMKLARNGFVTYGVPEGLLTVKAIFEDAAGGICFRAVVLDDQRPYAFDGAQSDLLHAEAENSAQRFGRFDGQRFEWFKPSVPFDFGYVPEQLAVQTSNGDWWVGSGAGVYRFPASDNFLSLKTARPLAVYTMKDGLPSPQVGRMFVDSGDNVWESGFGMARWDHAEQRWRNLENTPGLPSLKTDGGLSFAEDRAGNAWIGFYTGVARYRAGQYNFFDTKDWLPTGAIECLHVDRAGRLWLVSSRSGLLRLDDPTAERPAFRRYTTEQGLSSNSTSVLTEDHYGRIYVATARGLDQLAPDTGRIRHFTTDDGLAPGDLLAAYCDRQGAIWIGTHRGLSRFVPAPPEAAPPPPIFVTGLQVAGERRPTSAVGETEIALPDLAPDRNQLQIDFVALGFAPGEVLRYQYRLEGSDEDWRAVSAQRTVNFASLAPGNYRFLVRAVNSDGVASANPATVSFIILRPVWQRWWFVLLMALGLGLTALAFYRSRIRRLIELERVRTRIATDLHDDIGVNLTRISILSEVAKQQNGVGQSGHMLNSIAEIARESVASMSDIVWAINPAHDNLLDLTRRMRQLAEEVFTARDIRLKFAAPEDAHELKLEVHMRRDLYLIFKEAVNNAARHSGCTRAEIDVRVVGSQLNLTISDDGRGFDAMLASEGNGLRSMCNRARSLGGQLEIESSVGKGSRIWLRTPSE